MAIEMKNPGGPEKDPEEWKENKEWKKVDQADSKDVASNLGDVKTPEQKQWESLWIEKPDGVQILKDGKSISILDFTSIVERWQLNSDVSLNLSTYIGPDNIGVKWTIMTQQDLSEKLVNKIEKNNLRKGYIENIWKIDMTEQLKKNPLYTQEDIDNDLKVLSTEALQKTSDWMNDSKNSNKDRVLMNIIMNIHWDKPSKETDARATTFLVKNIS